MNRTHARGAGSSLQRPNVEARFLSDEEWCLAYQEVCLLPAPPRAARAILQGSGEDEHISWSANIGCRERIMRLDGAMGVVGLEKILYLEVAYSTNQVYATIRVGCLFGDAFHAHRPLTRGNCRPRRCVRTWNYIPQNDGASFPRALPLGPNDSSASSFQKPNRHCCL